LSSTLTLANLAIAVSWPTISWPTLLTIEIVVLSIVAVWLFQYRIKRKDLFERPTMAEEMLLDNRTIEEVLNEYLGIKPAPAPAPSAAPPEEAPEEETSTSQEVEKTELPSDEPDEIVVPNRPPIEAPKKSKKQKRTRRKKRAFQFKINEAVLYDVILNKKYDHNKDDVSKKKD